MSNNALIIFIKNPIKGQVKTRIARTMGDEQALDIYLALSKITRENALALKSTNLDDVNFDVDSQILRGPRCYVFYSDFIETDDEWSNIYFDKQLQTGQDLGKRMLNAFDFVLKKHASACIIGSDCPTLSVEILRQSFDKLADFDCVLGPSTDGGYYLLGLKNKEKNAKNNHFDLKKVLKHLFEKMVWSTDQVLPNTIKRIKENNQTVFLLPELTDIDEEADWLIFQKNR